MLRAAFGFVLIVGCVDSAAVECTDGLICPADYKCDDAHRLCIPPNCGNGVVDSGEECDGTTFGADEDCTSFGYYTKTGLACSTVCKIDTTGCSLTCGDHAINGPELCDGIPPVGLSCTDFGFDVGRLSCSNACAPGFAPCSSIGWQTVPGGATVQLTAVWGSGATNIFAVGFGGTILHSDGGAWLAMDSGTTADLYGVWGRAPNDVYAVGEGGVIVHFNGMGWNAMTSGTTSTLLAIGGTVLEPFAVGAGGTIVKLSGSGWSVVPPITAMNLRAIAANANAIVAVGEGRTILRYVAGTWSTMTAPTTPPVAPNLRGVWGVTDRFIAVGTAGTVYVFNGTTWVDTNQSVTSLDLLTVTGSALGDTFIGGELGTMLHFNGVVFEAHTLPPRTVFGVWAESSARVFAVTRSGTIEGYNGTLLTTVAPTADRLFTVWNRGDLAVAAGENGTLIRNAGSGWTTTAVTGTPTFTDVWGIGPNVFVASPVGVFKSTDGAASLPSTPSSAVESLLGVSGTSASDVFAVGPATQLRHYNGAGWATQMPPTLPPPQQRKLVAVWAIAPNDVYAVGDLGTILHYDGAWSAQTSGVTSNLRSVWGHANDVFIVGELGVILHNDGSGWRRMTWETSETLSFVRGSSGSDVFAGGLGVMLHYDGTSWSRMTAPQFVTARGAWATTDGLIYVGDSGGVSRLDRVLTPREDRCTDPWDNDGDGLINCADPDCVGDSCLHGGACAPAAHVVCEQTVAGSTFSGRAMIDDLRCLTHATPGPEAVYVITPLVDRAVTLALSPTDIGLDLVVVGEYGTHGCDLAQCTPAVEAADGSRTLTFDAKAGKSYYLIVDGPDNRASEFTLAITCP